VFAELGGLDARFFTFIEEVNYCRRALLRAYDIRVVDYQPVPREGGATPGGYVGERDGIRGPISGGGPWRGEIERSRPKLRKATCAARLRSQSSEV
jgi:hypothetical protein